MTSLDLAKPMHIRAEMARGGFAPMQGWPYEDPERGWLNPFDDADTQAAMRRFLGAIWDACLHREGLL